MSWSKRPIKWFEDGREHISIVFTWDLPAVRTYLLNGNFDGTRAIVGGPAVRLMPDYLADVAEIGWDSPGALQRHNPDATRTIRGCPNRCAYCGVRAIEPGFEQLNRWPIGHIICDNNILAGDDDHFDAVIDSLQRPVTADFQGIEARLLTERHAAGFASLWRKPILHLAWDNLADEQWVRRAITLLVGAKIPLPNIRVYVLFGFRDTPDDALYRFEALRGLGVMPNPMRYQPLNALKRNSYIAPGWDEPTLNAMSRFWARAALWRGKRFEDYNPRAIPTKGPILPGVGE